MFDWNARITAVAEKDGEAIERDLSAMEAAMIYEEWVEANDEGDLRLFQDGTEYTFEGLCFYTRDGQASSEMPLA